jgi:hypothetical protein
MRDPPAAGKSGDEERAANGINSLIGRARSTIRLAEF